MNRQELFQQKVETIKRLAKQSDKFSSSQYKFEFERANPDEIANFENSQGIVLPIEFRSFIQDIGFGTPPFLDVNHFEHLEFDKFDKEEDDDEEYQPFYDGFITLMHFGCGIIIILVIGGQHKGEIWHRGDLGLRKLANNYYEWNEQHLDDLIKKLGNNEIG